MKTSTILTIILICILALITIWCVVNRRVVRAWFFGEPMPEPPKWRIKLFLVPASVAYVYT